MSYSPGERLTGPDVLGMNPLPFDVRMAGLTSVAPVSWQPLSGRDGAIRSVYCVLRRALVANAVMTVPDAPDFTSWPSSYHVKPRMTPCAKAGGAAARSAVARTPSAIADAIADE